MTRTRRLTADDLPPRSATLRSEVAHAGTAAAALSPDDTDDVDTRVDDGAAIVEIERPTTSSLVATIDDAVVALDVALDVAAIADEHVDRATSGGERARSSEDEHSHSTRHRRSPDGDEPPADGTDDVPTDGTDDVPANGTENVPADDATDGRTVCDDPSDPDDTEQDDT